MRVSSVTDVDECLGFTLDEPFGNRPFNEPPTGCVKPRSTPTAVTVTFDGLTDDDISFPVHTLVWGIPGAHCGIVFTTLGMCVVEQAGTVPVNFSDKYAFPTFGPIGTFRPCFTLSPEFR